MRRYFNSLKVNLDIFFLSFVINVSVDVDSDDDGASEEREVGVDVGNVTGDTTVVKPIFF